MFCGSRPGTRPDYAAATRAFAVECARLGVAIVYGGGRVGLMGEMAGAALAAGGRVVGVIPHALRERELAHAGLSELHLVDTLQQRKARMFELADAFVVLPGGLGTLDELFEVWTWRQLGMHGKPIGLLEVDDYFADLCAFLDRAMADGFIDSGHGAALQRSPDPVLLLHRLVDEGAGRAGID